MYSIYKIDNCHIVKNIYYKVANTHTNFRFTFAHNYINTLYKYIAYRYINPLN